MSTDIPDAPSTADPGDEDAVFFNVNRIQLIADLFNPKLHKKKAKKEEDNKKVEDNSFVSAEYAGDDKYKYTDVFSL